MALTRWQGRELDDKKIQVNAIAPGLTESEGVKTNPAFQPSGAPRFATRLIKREKMPEDLLGTLIYLCSSDSDFVVLANDSELGLCSLVWMADSDRAVRVARRLEAGYAYLNNHGPLSKDWRALFGGFKLSEIGRNLGFEGTFGFTESHSIIGPGGFLF